MGGIGTPEIIFIAVIVLIFFGAKNLPEIGKSLGEAIKEFRRAGKSANNDNQKLTNPSGNKKSHNNEA